MASIGNLNTNLTLNSANFQSGLRRAAQTSRQAQSQMSRSFSHMSSSANSAFKAMSAAAGAVGFGALLVKITQVNKEYQKLNGMLVTATGTQAAAARSMGELQKFAATTPFALSQTVEAFVKLKNLGLNPSMAAMKSYGNTASAMGKDLMQLIEAVADASTGEFERLKEFGIKSKQEGEQVKFTFQGVTTTVAKNATAIQDYLLKIGNTQFAGSMDRQAATLGGAMSNLGDTMAQLAVKFGEAGFAPALEEAIRGLEKGSGSLENFARSAGYLTGTVLGNLVSMTQTLATNFDKLVVAAEVVGAVMLGRFVAGLRISRIEMTALSATTKANIAAMLMFARVGPAIGVATAAIGGLAAAGRGLLALFGGPVGIAIAGVSLALSVLATRSATASASALELSQSIQSQATQFADLIAKQNKAAAATGKLDETQKAALAGVAALTGEANLLANAWARVAAEAKRAELAQATADLRKSNSNLRSATDNYSAKRTEIERDIRNGRSAAPSVVGGSAMAVGMSSTSGPLTPAEQKELQRRLNASQEAKDLATASRTTGALATNVRDILDNPLGDYREKPAAAAVASSPKDKSKKR